MATIVTLTDEEGGEIQFLVDGDTPRGGGGRFQTKGGNTSASPESMEVEKSFGAYFDPIRRLANQLAAKIGEVDVKPSEVEVQVGVKLTTEANVIFAKAGADAEMTVKLVWKNGATA